MTTGSADLEQCVLVDRDGWVSARWGDADGSGPGVLKEKPIERRLGGLEVHEGCVGAEMCSGTCGDGGGQSYGSFSVGQCPVEVGDVGLLRGDLLQQSNRRPHAIAHGVTLALCDTAGTWLQCLLCGLQTVME